MAENTPPEEDDDGPGPLGKAAMALGLAFLCFFAGAWVVMAELWPHRQLRNVHLGVVALRKQIVGSTDRFSSSLWYQAAGPRTGVVVHDQARAFDGATIYTSPDVQGAVLVDMDGAVLHRWTRDFREIFPGAPHLQRVPPEHLLYMAQATLLDDGSILAIYNADLNTPWGAGLVKLDRDSKVLWALPLKAHHDLEVQPDGTLYVLTHELRETRDGDPPLEIDDHLSIVSRDGKLQRTVSLNDALEKSRYRNLLGRGDEFYNTDRGDPLHSNAVEVLTTETAGWVPEGKPGRVLLSLRSPDALVLLDLDEEAVVWAGRGPWEAQHDPDLVGPNRVLLFDNRGDVGPAWPTRVIEVDLVTSEVTWEYGGTAEDQLWSRVRGSQQRLPNGNVLISESVRGRILEVTREGDVVWDYRNPARGGPENGLVAAVIWPERVPRDRLGWLPKK